LDRGSSTPARRKCYLNNAWLAAEALGKRYGREAFSNLLEYRWYTRSQILFGQYVGLYESSVLMGVMQGFGEMNIPEGVKEIFSILSMREEVQWDEGKNPIPVGVGIYRNIHVSSLIEVAVAALSKVDENVIRSSLENNFWR